MKNVRLISVVAAAVVVAAVACAPPEKKGGTTGNGAAAGQATSMADFGGMDGLIAAAKKEGELNVIALPPDWANYGVIIKTFGDKYGIKVNSAQPDAASQDEINAANQQKGRSTAPDVFDLGQSVALANKAMFAPYKVATFDSIPTEMKAVDGSLVNDYGGYMSIGYDSAKVPDLSTVNDLLKPDYKGKVALNGDPTQAGAAFSGVAMVALSQGGSADKIAPGGVEFFTKLKQAATSCRSTRRRRPSSRARHLSSSTGTTSTPPRPRSCRAGRCSCRRTRCWAATTFRRSTRRLRTRPRPGCGRSSSSATRGRTCTWPAVPDRCAPTPW